MALPKYAYTVKKAFRYSRPQPDVPYTDKKENQIFFIYREIQSGAVAKLDMTNGLLIYGETFGHFLIYQEALPNI